MQELCKALDSGAQVPLESQPACLLAVILKNFLRKIPSKLLEVERYEEWMGALQKTSRQEKLAGLKEVASKLPKANLVLLQQLLSLLQNISSNAATSKMTAHNLAICMGPNLLSPAEEHTLPLDVLAQATEKVTQLVEFLIEHHEELFAEEVAGLAGTSDEESPAPELGAAAAEVPPVTPESQHLKSSSGERRLPGSSQGNRKRKGSCEEGSDGQEEEEAGAEALRDGQLRESEQVPICFCSLDSPMSSDATASTDTTRAQHHLSGGEERGAVPLCSGQQIEVTHC
ncbi:T-cell activation Rho GTPase-activating protein-like [Athene cunicularia]|uniref:T-cell activation Rho GTPase-activating protein-like n=1 Tax=Athene cunicularia TaxID=194338 RepID=UPI000EF68B2D|nr:T-cell activation Rho GTPase-activating protein-like [Athene cunicularia]